ncbi:MAG: arylsulfatase [Saprospiraceae bacterium]|nr:arylsulfatase [Saprospiraceae bacterium]
MRNSIVLFCISTLLLTYGCASKPTTVSEERPPNIIIMLADDQGWGDLSHSGNTDISTPNIDALAANGASFDRFYVNPVCSPTRAEFLTGRYHTRGGVYSTSAGGERLDLDETTIAEVFKQAGYQTAAYGKWHNGMQGPYHPNARGFDEFYGFCSGHWGNYFSPMLEHNGVITKGEGFLVDDLTNQAMDFITQHREDPFFVYLPYNTPHSPMQVPERFWEKFADKPLSLHSQDTSKENELHMKAALAMCENIDWNVGRLMEKLEALDLTEETIVIYFSDNGPNGWRWNGGMKGRKGSTDEGGVRSPFFIQWRGTIPAEMNISPIAAGIDILPTLADLADIGVETRKPLDGISLAPLLLKDPPAWSDRMIFSHWRGNVSVRNQGFRLDKDNQLYDMTADPGQSQDVSEANAAVATELKAAKEKWMAEVMSELNPDEKRPFLIGHPDFEWTQIPARDGLAHGNIERSNRWPNCSFFTNWVAAEDKITWEVEVMEEGDFEVIVYYTCPPEDVGSDFELSFLDQRLAGKIEEANDPPLRGMEHDYVERQESYVKDFKPLSIGEIHLPKGAGELVLQATSIPGKQVMDFRLIMLRRVQAGG